MNWAGKAGRAQLANARKASGRIAAAFARARSRGRRALIPFLTAGFPDPKDTLSVISAIGTRGYYRRHGFEDGALYQHRRLGDGARET